MLKNFFPRSSNWPTITRAFVEMKFVILFFEYAGNFFRSKDSLDYLENNVEVYYFIFDEVY